MKIYIFQFDRFSSARSDFWRHGTGSKTYPNWSGSVFDRLLTFWSTRFFSVWFGAVWLGFSVSRFKCPPLPRTEKDIANWEKKKKEKRKTSWFEGRSTLFMKSSMHVCSSSVKTRNSHVKSLIGEGEIWDRVWCLYLPQKSLTQSTYKKILRN